METSNTLKCGLCTNFEQSRRVLFQLPCSHWYCYECIMKKSEKNNGCSFICKFDDTSFPDPFIFLTFENSNTNKEILTCGNKKIMCNIHLDEEIKYYCSDDNTNICDKCFSKHFSHKDQIKLFDYEVKHIELNEFEKKLNEEFKFMTDLREKIKKVKEQNIMENELAHLEIEILNILGPIINNDAKNQSSSKGKASNENIIKALRKDPSRSVLISFILIIMVLPIIDIMQENASLKFTLNKIYHEKVFNSKLLKFINESMASLPPKFFHDFPDYKPELTDIDGELLHKLNLSITNHLLLKSKIFFYAENKDFVNTFFQQNIKNLVLCYRASENSFDAKIYHQKCDGRGSWMLLARSEEGAIFGGFSGKSSLGSKNIKWDLSPNNFLFSFTHRTKHFSISHQQFANFTYHELVGPYFCNDLFINDFANLKDRNYSRKIYFNDSAFSELGSCYSLPKNIEFGSKIAHSFLGGNSESDNFALSEYEVFLVEFEGMD